MKIFCINKNQITNNRQRPVWMWTISWRLRRKKTNSNNLKIHCPLAGNVASSCDPATGRPGEADGCGRGDPCWDAVRRNRTARHRIWRGTGGLAGCASLAEAETGQVDDPEAQESRGRQLMVGSSLTEGSVSAARSAVTRSPFTTRRCVTSR